MKKIVILLAAVVTMLVMTGCVNQALLKSSSLYRDSTEPYLQMVLDSNLIENAEKDSLRTNMIEFKKTIDKYETNKSWWEM